MTGPTLMGVGGAACPAADRAPSAKRQTHEDAADPAVEPDEHQNVGRYGVSARVMTEKRSLKISTPMTIISKPATTSIAL